MVVGLTVLLLESLRGELDDLGGSLDVGDEQRQYELRVFGGGRVLRRFALRHRHAVRAARVCACASTAVLALAVAPGR